MNAMNNALTPTEKYERQMSWLDYYDRRDSMKKIVKLNDKTEDRINNAAIDSKNTPDTKGHIAINIVGAFKQESPELTPALMTDYKILAHEKKKKLVFFKFYDQF